MSMLLVALMLEVNIRMYTWWTSEAGSGALHAALAVVPAFLALILYITLLATAWGILRRKSLIDHLGYIIASVLVLDHALSNQLAYQAIIGAQDGTTALGYSTALIAYGITTVGLCLMPFWAMAARGRPL